MAKLIFITIKSPVVGAAPGPEPGHSGRQFLSSLISPHHAAGTELQTPSLLCLLAAACRDPSISIPRPARCDERVTSRAAVTLCHTASRVTVSQLCQSSVPSWHGRLAPRSWSWHIKYQPFIPLSPHPIAHQAPVSRLQAPALRSVFCWRAAAWPRCVPLHCTIGKHAVDLRKCD